MKIIDSIKRREQGRVVAATGKRVCETPGKRVYETPALLLPEHPAAVSLR